MIHLSDFVHDVELPSYDDFISWGDVTARGRDNERKDYGRGMLLYALMCKYKPSTILEIGTGRGYSATCMIHALRRCNVSDISLTTVDKDGHKKVKKRPDGVEASVKLLMSKTLGSLDEVTFLQGESKDVWPRLKNAVFDFIFVDGSHKTDAVIHDCHESLKLIANNGNIVFHDYKCPSTRGVTQALDECMPLLQEKFETFEVCTRGDFSGSDYITTGEMGSLVCLRRNNG